MPYLTPETLPTEDQCRRLLIPSSPEWLAIVSGALTELTLTWNWQQKGITVTEALEAAQGIVASYYNQPCQDPEACFLPEGTALIRRLPSGYTEQFIDGVWTTPEGDYASTPPEPREEATEVDRLCLASANTAHVLRLTYEEVVEAYEEFALVEDVIEAMLGITAFLIAPYVAVGTLALLALEALAFNTFFEALEFVGADDWSDEFHEDLICLLLEHASEDAEDRVTYNFQEFYAEVNRRSLDFTNTAFMRPYAQLAYMLYYIGAEGINSSSGTTGVADYDCDDCEGEWCAYFDFTIDQQGWSLVGSTTFGVYTAGVGWQSQYKVSGAGYRACNVGHTISSSTITQFRAEYDVTWGGTQGAPSNARNASLRLNQTAVPNDPARVDPPNTAGVLEFAGTLTAVTSLNFLSTVGYDATAPIVDQGGQITLKNILVRGTGTNPFSGYDCP